jgi:hypothetical protein
MVRGRSHTSGASTFTTHATSPAGDRIQCARSTEPSTSCHAPARPPSWSSSTEPLIPTRLAPAAWSPPDLPPVAPRQTAAACLAQRGPSSGPHNSAAARSLTSNAVASDIEQATDEAFPQRLVAALPGCRSAGKRRWKPQRRCTPRPPRAPHAPPSEAGAAATAARPTAAVEGSLGRGSSRRRDEFPPCRSSGATRGRWARLSYSFNL